MGISPVALAVCLCLLVGRADGQAFSAHLPIGALFDLDQLETRSSFTYQISEYNGHQNRLKLQANSLRVLMNDSFTVSTEMCNLMSNGIFALFGTHRINSINTLKSFTRMFKMPFISSSMAVNTSGQELGYELYMRPYYAQAFVDMLKHYEWREIYYIYDSNEGLARLQQLLDGLTADGWVVKTNVLRVADGDDALETLKRIDSKKEEDKRVILDLPREEVEKLLQRERKETRNVQHHYFLAGLVINEISLDAFNHGGMNITGFRLVDFENSTIKSFLNKWKILNPEAYIGAGRNKIAYEAALAVDAVNLVGKALTQIIARDPNVFQRTLRKGKVYNNNTEGIDCDADPPIPWQHGYDIMKTMREMEFMGLSGRVAFDKFGLRRDYKLDVLEVSLNRGLAQVGSWISERGLVIQSPSLVRTKGNNTIANKTRIVTSILTAPYLLLKKDLDDKENDKLVKAVEAYEGYCADLVKKIANFVGFEYEIRPVKDGKYGAKDDNGTWNGMVGELVRHEADLAVAPLTITSVRERVIDFSKPFMSLGISIMIKKPTKPVPGVFSFMYPLSYEVWMCVIFAYIGVSVVLFLVSRFSPFEWHIEDNTDGPTVTNNFTIFNSLWFSLGAFMQQGCDIEPRSMSGRIVGSVWWFFTLIVISSYTANLAAFLTVERMQSPIESADDLAKQTEIKYGTIDSGSTKAFFKSSTIPVYERMWAFMSSAEPSVFVSSNEEGVRRVRIQNGRYAFLTESTTNDYINQRQPCDTMKVGSNLDSKGYGIGTPLGSDLRDQVTLAVLELRENGELAKLEKKWWYDLGQCGAEKKSGQADTSNTLKLADVAGMFYILIGGLVLALIMAVIEFLYKSRMEARRRKTTISNAIRSKARLSITGKPERQTTAVGAPDLPPNMSMSTYTYAPASQLISLDGYADGNTHTQIF